MTEVTREILPDTRDSITHKAKIYDKALGDYSLFITVGLYPPDEIEHPKIGDSLRRPGEVWINIGKQGTTLRGLCDTTAISLSMSLQYGVPLEAIVAQFKNHRYEPLVATSNPDIPQCTSIIDYVVQWLEFMFLKEEVDAST